MIYKLNIFTNLVNKDFFDQLLSKYSLKFHSINSLKNNFNNNKSGIIILNKNNDYKIDFKNLKGNFILISNITIDTKESIKNLKILKTPITPNQIKNELEKFLLSNEIQFKDIIIVDKKVTNITNQKICYLTEIENDIIFYLIKHSNPNKKYIRENILKIKNNIQTNSIESHLSRIRKKFEKIKTKILVQTKKENVTIN